MYLILRYDGEILVAQSPFEGAIGAWVKGLARLFGKKLFLIIENHNNFEEDVFLQRNIPLKGIYQAVMLGLARYAFRHGDAVRVISSSTIARAKHYAPNLPQVRFMTWSNTDIFSQTARTVPVDVAQDIVYAGVLIPRKGVHHLLDAFAQLDHATAQLYLVGHPENAVYAEALRQQASELKISERVHFVGGVSQQELADYFAKARVMVLPSLSEGLGRVVVEAMLLGIPVIGSRVGGIPDMVTDGETGFLVEADDVASLTDALQRIYTVDVATMGQNALAFAQDFFSTSAYVDGYRTLFEMSDK
jgi:glycosyltransferase involved in cell wall biosynthesis